MHTWIIYDISKNKARLKVAKLCRRMGMHRVQKSVFLGRLDKGRLRQFRREVNRTINLRTDKLFIVPLSKTAFKGLLRYGKDAQAPLLPSKNEINIF